MNPSRPMGDPEWSAILHGYDGDRATEAHVAELQSHDSCPDGLDAEDRRLYAALWLDAHRVNGLWLEDRVRSKRMVAVRSTCCSDGVYPVLAGVHRVPGLGACIEESWTASKVVDAPRPELFKLRGGLLGGTQVVSDITADRLMLVCGDCGADLPLLMHRLRAAISDFHHKGRSQRVDLSAMH